MVGPYFSAFCFELGAENILRDLSAHACEEKVPDGNDVAALAARGRTIVVKCLVSLISMGRVGQLRENGETVGHAHFSC